MRGDAPIYIWATDTPNYVGNLSGASRMVMSHRVKTVHCFRNTLCIGATRAHSRRKPLEKKRLQHSRGGTVSYALNTFFIAPLARSDENVLVEGFECSTLCPS